VSYSITISGHLDGADAPEREAKIVEDLSAVAADLDGCTYASMSGQFTGVTYLRSANGTSLPPPPAAPPVPDRPSAAADPDGTTTAVGSDDNRHG